MHVSYDNIKKKFFLDPPKLLSSKTLKRDREYGAENTPHLNIIFSVLLEIFCPLIII